MKEQEMTKGIVSPPVGWVVQYVYLGDDSQLMAATVVERSEHGQVGVVLLLPRGGTPRNPMNSRFVRHRDDPHFELHPQTRSGGFWQYIPGLQYGPTKEEQNYENEYSERQQESFLRSLESKKKRESVSV